MSGAERRLLVARERPGLPVRRQCALLGLARSGLYHAPAAVDPEDLALMRRPDAQCLETPFYGVRRMTVALRQAGFAVGRKRVRRLMRVMGLKAPGPKPGTSRPAPGTTQDLPLSSEGAGDRAAEPKPAPAKARVWCADITFIPMLRGIPYLVAVMGWLSRYVLAWRLSNTLDAVFRVEARSDTLVKGQPDIFDAFAVLARTRPSLPTRATMPKPIARSAGSSASSPASAAAVSPRHRASAPGAGRPSAATPGSWETGVWPCVTIASASSFNPCSMPPVSSWLPRDWHRNFENRVLISFRENYPRILTGSDNSTGTGAGQVYIRAVSSQAALSKAPTPTPELTQTRPPERKLL
jgi:hypothetical protein